METFETTIGGLANKLADYGVMDALELAKLVNSRTYSSFAEYLDFIEENVNVKITRPGPEDILHFGAIVKVTSIDDCRSIW